MKDVMIDLETLGKGPNKIIVQIGAVYFDRITGELGSKFKVNIDPRSHERQGGTLDADTVMWWLSQDKKAQESILADPKVSIWQAFLDFSVFVQEAERIWSHATFDFVTLCSTYQQLGMKQPFSFKAGMDLRTLTYLAKISPQDFKREGVHHDGLDDAVFQVQYAVAALNKIQGDRVVITKLKSILS